MKNYTQLLSVDVMYIHVPNLMLVLVIPVNKIDSGFYIFVAT